MCVIPAIQENCLIQEAEVAVSWDHTIALQPGQQERNSVSKKKIIPIIFYYIINCLMQVSWRLYAKSTSVIRDFNITNFSLVIVSRKNTV